MSDTTASVRPQGGPAQVGPALALLADAEAGAQEAGGAAQGQRAHAGAHSRRRAGQEAATRGVRGRHLAARGAARPEEGHDGEAQQGADPGHQARDRVLEWPGHGVGQGLELHAQREAAGIETDEALVEQRPGEEETQRGGGSQRRQDDVSGIHGTLLPRRRPV
jgi:hypothetical protein